MVQIISMLFHPLPNAIMTVLLGISALYWLLTFLAGDFLADIDFDGEVDFAADGDLAAEPSFFQKALSFINVGKVPIMVVITMFKFISWIFTMTSSMIWDLSSWGWKSGLILIPIFIIAFFITRWATKPFVKIYKQMGYSGEQQLDLIGRTARLKSTIKDEQLGTAELTIQSDVIKIIVKSKNGKPIDFDALVTVQDESIDKKFYYVEEEINLDNVLK